ncbi:hypothetical protein BDZ94DRAFT_1278821 [Collybia nuda]|uniref:Uncharacterized protein n=1 Tax=Collybia nuda TaxID=64659 RepID=A0A9P6CR35_9AGAR|nr:hypothetical protein BDZ94DRAFT_1278821 [Collybia nuda]
MPRPRPLTNLTSARPTTDYQQLTPRTPHSRSGRAEEGYTEFELQQLNENDDDYATETQQQAVPLLSSSASDSFPSTGYRHRGDDFQDEDKDRRAGKLDFNTIMTRLPLVMGGLVAGFLFILVVFSYDRPERLHRYFGAKVPGNSSSPSESSAPNENTTSSIPPHNLISYANYTKFPLLGSEYRNECHKLNQGFMSHGKYWEPHETGMMDVAHHESNSDYMLPEGQRTAVCSSTITYQLDGEVGLLADLALMAQAAALARDQNRTFLVDDTYWNRGKWTDHFQNVRTRQPGPERGCRAPPAEELVACPRLASFQVVNSRTAKFHFGHGFEDAYEDAYAHQLNRVRPMFDAALISLQQTIRPNAENAALIRAVRAELSEILSLHSKDVSPYLGVHIRRGDRRPASWSFHGGYVPTSDYVQSAEDTWERLNPGKPLTVYIASDVPSAQREYLELSDSRHTAFSLSQSKDSKVQALASPQEYVQKEFNELEKSQRIRATRGMIIDFALLSGLWAWKDEITPDATICTLSSNVCKLSAVGLGWKKAFGEVDKMGYIDQQQKGWVEIDQKGQIVPVWEPFELFT